MLLATIFLASIISTFLLPQISEKLSRKPTHSFFWVNSFQTNCKLLNPSNKIMWGTKFTKSKNVTMASLGAMVILAIFGFPRSVSGQPQVSEERICTLLTTPEKLTCQREMLFYCKLLAHCRSMLWDDSMACTNGHDLRSHPLLSLH